MIPTMTQDAPNIVPRHWCSNCGRKLMPHDNCYNLPADNFCPGCGQEIEWEKEVPVKWEPMDCDTCGNSMIMEVQGHMVSNGNYVGTTTCRTCMTEYCTQTNCLGCTRGTYPDCKYKHLKRPANTEEAE